MEHEVVRTFWQRLSSSLTRVRFFLLRCPSSNRYVPSFLSQSRDKMPHHTTLLRVSFSCPGENFWKNPEPSEKSLENLPLSYTERLPRYKLCSSSIAYAELTPSISGNNAVLSRLAFVFVASSHPSPRLRYSTFSSCFLPLHLSLERTRFKDFHDPASLQSRG